MPAEYLLYIMWLKCVIYIFSAFIMNGSGAFCLLLKGFFENFVNVLSLGKSLGQILRKAHVS